MASKSVRDLLDHAAHFLPAQGPVTSFVHHNTLHAFEHLPFERAVEEAAALFRCQPYLSEERYRSELEQGRIRSSDLEAVLSEELGPRAEEAIAGLVRRADLRWTMLLDPVRLASEAELRWVVAAGGALNGFRRRCPPLTRERIVADTRQWVMRDLRGDGDANAHLRAMAADVLARRNERRIEGWSRGAWEEVTLTLLWRICRAGLHGSSGHRVQARPVRLREPLREASGIDTDLWVHEVLIRFCTVFADQGLAAWSLPRRDQGFYRSFLALHGSGYPLRADWLKGMPEEIARLETGNRTAEELLEESLTAFGVTAEERSDFVLQSLLALRGWAGMLWQLESRPDRARRAAPAGTLMEFLAIRLLLDRLASSHVAREVLRSKAPLDELRRRLRARACADEELTPTQRAFVLFLLAQSLGWSPRRLSTLLPQEWGELAAEVQGFSEIERRRLFHRAYERRYRVKVLDALAAHRPRAHCTAGTRPALQVVTCIDEREESLRRHIEEIEPEAETFGAAGFFGVAMYYRGVSDAHGMPLCPVAIRPAHRVHELVREADRPKHARGASWSRRIGVAALNAHAASRGLLAGLATTLVGSCAAAPLVARVLFPRLAAWLRGRAGRLVRSPVQTELAIERDAVQEGRPAVQDDPTDGFSPEEMADVVERMLRDLGLARSFARLVVVIGHGSSSLNNPHESAHDCGACGGGRGGPNARAFAHMANHPLVRTKLAAAGIVLPMDTVFVGAYHNTCDDSLIFFDTDGMPRSHEGDLGRARASLERACQLNAHERCRRFRSAGLLIAPEEALRHVQTRSEDLAQPRPEFGHATNAVCLVGRRARTVGLFLDRRAFLVSYDPAVDAGDRSSPVLERILAAVVPVCAGINLEYFFSYVDPTGWGCGTKLPHNIAALLGVMDGATSDLRPGLPWQMVEIHEPVRLSLIVETTPARLSSILGRSPALARSCENEWIWLATLDPDAARIHVFERGAFRPYAPETLNLPEVPSSERWYSGLREHLEFAAVAAPRTEPKRGARQ